mmetsp:Transcript_39267/g.90739  ORF Transcript_39267/g.90739 Transcript_39267/m.90739 type:complete len:534 (+) Transcript_39267:44-1645(+)
MAGRHPPPLPPVPKVVVKQAGSGVLPPGTAIGRGQDTSPVANAPLPYAADDHPSAAATADGGSGSAPAGNTTSPDAVMKDEDPSKCGTVCASLLRKRMLGQALGGVAFSMGLAWKGATLAIVSAKHYMQDPGDIDNLGALWVITAVITCMFIVAIIALLQYEAGLKRRAEDASLEGDGDLAFSLRVKERSVHAIIHWGLTFAVAAQIDSAVSATLPKSPSFWRILYVAVLFVVVACVVVIVRSAAEDAKKDRDENTESKAAELGSLGSRASMVARVDILDAGADAIVSGSGYVMALALLSATDAVFELEQASSSVDLDYLALYTACCLVIISLVLPSLALKDSSDAARSSEVTDVAVPKMTQISRAVRKLIGKACAMSGVIVVYALLYVALASSLGKDGASLYDPLPIGGGFLFFVIALLTSGIGGVLVRFCTRTLLKRLSDVDTTIIPGDIDDIAIGALQKLTETTSTTVLEAFSWLVGVSCYNLVLSVWEEIVSNEDPSEMAAIFSGLGLATFLTVVSVTLVACIPMPPKS